jgi:predicted phosphoribosyltransferase
LPHCCFAQQQYGNNNTENDDVLKLAQSRAFESLESVRQSVREFSAVQQQEVRERLGEIRNKIEEAF